MLLKIIKYLKKFKIVGPLSYAHNGLNTVNINCEFMTDKFFLNSYDQASKITGWRHPGPWRLYINCWAISRAISLNDGDLIECGTFKGTTALAGLIYSNDIKLKNFKYNFYLMDSFEGINLKDIMDGENINIAEAANTKYKDLSKSKVESYFKDFQFVKVIKGYIPSILDSVKSDKISYLHIDLNAAKPEVDALEFFYEKLIPGGIIILDDYNWLGRTFQKKEIDKFLKKKEIECLALPTGTGILVKK